MSVDTNSNLTADKYTYTNSTTQNVFDVTPSITVASLFTGTKDFKDVTRYRLMRGVPDFGSLVQFNPYETGYAAFIICQMPKFMEMLAKNNTEYNKLVSNWAHIIEYEFKSFDGLEGITADTQQLGDDLNNINVITKVNMQSASEFSLTYDEKSGTPLTKFAKLYLTGIKDPRTQVKTYHGLIHKNVLEPGFENEVFTFLFITTDNTMREVENAVLLIGCQLNSADTDMYNYTKGDIGKREVTVKFSGYPVQSPKINNAAREMMAFLLSDKADARKIVINSNEYDYTGVEQIGNTLYRYGGKNNTELGIETNTAQYTADKFYLASESGDTDTNTTT